VSLVSGEDKPLERDLCEGGKAEVLRDRARLEGGLTWNESEGSKPVPDGNMYLIELMTIGHPEAVSIPESVFNCARDER
jgi:hypothetical protein